MTSEALYPGAPSGRWLRRFHSREQSRVRLVCLPHAGGAATSYRSWHRYVPDCVDVVAIQYPGRQERIDEPCIDDMAELAGEITQALTDDGNGPLALFGHGMGAVVAYEVSVSLQRRGQLPVQLFVSGQPAPSRHRDGTVHRGTDAELVAELRRLSGVEPELLVDRRLRGRTLPAIRADYHAIETYRPPAVAPLLRCPVTSYYGLGDSGVNEADAGNWYEVTQERFHLCDYPGDHFYLVPRERQLVNDLIKRLAATAPAVLAVA